MNIPSRGVSVDPEAPALGCPWLKGAGPASNDRPRPEQPDPNPRGSWAP